MKRVHRYMKAIFLVCLTVSCANALAAEKDLRTRSDAKGYTEIGFCSRPSRTATLNFPGHAFVTFSETTLGGRTFRAVGHTVAGTDGLPATLFTYFGGKPVAGRQAEERYTDIQQTCLMVKMDREAYEKAVKAARPTLTALGIPDSLAASAENYSLNSNDCIDFAVRVANSLKDIGLNVPTRTATDTPGSYIAKFSAANP